jgi:hypothetical protein
MSDTEDDMEDPMVNIRKHIEELSHLSKDLYARALRVKYSLDHNTQNDMWTQRFQLQEKVYPWAKKHLVSRKCSLLQLHQTLLHSAKKEGRITAAGIELTQEEETLLEVKNPVSIVTLLQHLPKFFLKTLNTP